LDECRKLRGCETGQAKITGGYNLKARFVIHTVGPVWQGGRHGEPELLASCYRNSVQLAQARGLASIAFPGISTGVFGYPREPAAKIAIASVQAQLSGGTPVREVLFCCFSSADQELYERLLSEIGHSAR
jgi:O-acetyl-ADP-ribose deacetylase (regulator of RNase III)